MFKLKVTNNYILDINMFDRFIVPGETYEWPKAIDFMRVDTIHLGIISFVDIGKKQIGGHSELPFGVLISYQGSELLYRYEKEGYIEMTVSDLGQVHKIKADGDLELLKITSFKIND